MVLPCRWDDRKHWLFRTLHKEHHEDYHQACIKGATIEKGGRATSLPALSLAGLHVSTPCKLLLHVRQQQGRFMHCFSPT